MNVEQKTGCEIQAQIVKLRADIKDEEMRLQFADSGQARAQSRREIQQLNKQLFSLLEQEKPKT